MIAGNGPKVEFVSGEKKLRFGSITFETLAAIDDAFCWPQRRYVFVLTQDERGNPNAVVLYDMNGVLIDTLKSKEGLRPYYFTKLANGEPGVVCSIEPAISGWGEWNCAFDLDRMELRRVSPSK